jgi:predicted short-subunit dehydrogenase-like oxidoreductase (DUF2520 family)
MNSKAAPDLNRTYGVLGLGRLGSSLAFSFKHHGAKVLTKYRQGDFATWLQQVDVVCLCIRDDELPEFVATHRHLNFANKVVLCHSGVTPLTVLQPFAEQGAVIGKWHPLQSFTNNEPAIVPPHTHWAFEGEIEDLIAPWTIAWDGVLHHLSGKDWQVYHLAAVLAANYLPLLIRMGSSVLEPLARDRQDALDWLKPLIEQSVAAGLDGQNDLPFSGPAIRGDTETLNKHSAWLAEHQPEFQALFMQASELLMGFKKISEKWI